MEMVSTGHVQMSVSQTNNKRLPGYVYFVKGTKESGENMQYLTTVCKHGVCAKVNVGVPFGRLGPAR